MGGQADTCYIITKITNHRNKSPFFGMDLSKARPRVLGSQLPRNVGRAVTVMGTVVANSLDHSGSHFRLNTADNQTVNVTMSLPLNERLDGLVEIHGTVDTPTDMTCHEYVMFPPESALNFDMSAYEKALTFLHRLPARSYDVVQPVQMLFSLRDCAARRAHVLVQLAQSCAARRGQRAEGLAHRTVTDFS